MIFYWAIFCRKSELFGISLKYYDNHVIEYIFMSTLFWRQVSTNENNLYIDLGNLFRKCKNFFSSEHSNGMLGDFYHAGNPSDVE